jgi:hypothetical protein
MFFAVLNALALAIRLGGDRSVSSRARAFTGVAGDELSEGWTSSNDSPSISLPVQGSAASTLEFALVACGTGIWRQHKRGSIFSGSYFVVKPSASKSTRSICWLQQMIVSHLLSMKGQTKQKTFRHPRPNKKHSGTQQEHFIQNGLHKFMLLGENVMQLTSPRRARGSQHRLKSILQGVRSAP